MANNDPNLAKVELLAAALNPLIEQLVFVGGCAVGLLITDTAAAPVRVTYDVDLVVKVAALSAYHGLEKSFSRDLSDSFFIRPSTTGASPAARQTAAC
jgi:hypothetical protein